MIINFFNYTGKREIINKSLGVSNALNGLLYNRFDTITPVIKIRYNGNFPFNYAYINEFDKYYFIEKITRIDNNYIEISFEIDVLKTYSNALLLATGTITESDSASAYLSTRDIITDVRPNFNKLDFSVNAPFDADGKIIMITLKGNV